LGSELVSDSPPLNGGKSVNGSAPSSLTEQFYEHLPFYLSIGMSYEQYWDGDCLLARYYRKAHQMKQQRRNQELWLQGAYFYEALTDVAPVLHAFAKKGTKATLYVSEPFALTDKEVRERRKREERLRYDKQKAKVAAWAAKTNMQMAGREVKQDG
jgi:hypothetical protein